MNRKQYTYYAWASNDSGATVDVANKERYSSLRALETAARSELGSGWTVHVIGIQHDGDNGWFAPEEIKTFRIR